MVAGGERGNIISFSELDWVETRRTGGEGDRKRKGGSQRNINLTLIGKLTVVIVLPIDYIKETPPSVGL